MEIERKFIQNYLSKNKSEYGQLVALLFISLCLLMSYIYWNDLWHLQDLLSANKRNVFQAKEYWRLFTTLFVHADLKHLLSNSLMLFILIYFVTSFYGVINALVTSILMGGVINAFTISMYQGDTTLVGASGVLFYLWGFWLVLYLGIETQKSIVSRLLRVSAVFFILLVPTSLDPQTSYIAHYSGFVLGVIIGSFYFVLYRKYLKEFEIWETLIIQDEDYTSDQEISPEEPHSIH